jgi:SAM-dependent methyltransferase
MFSGLALDLQRRLNPAQQTLAEADFIEKLLQLPPGAALADVPCGDGRLAIELASRGYDLTAVDLAPQLVADAQRVAAQRQLPVNASVGDMLQLRWHEQFDAVYCFGNSFAYFDDEGNRRFLCNVQRALKTGGRFVLQTNLIAESILSTPNSRNWYEFGDVMLCHASNYDWREGRLNSEYRFLRNGASEEKYASYRVYFFRELMQMLHDAGFDSIADYGSLQGEPFSFGARNLYLVATKA